MNKQKPKLDPFIVVILGSIGFFALGMGGLIVFDLLTPKPTWPTTSADMPYVEQTASVDAGVDANYVEVYNTAPVDAGATYEHHHHNKNIQHHHSIPIHETHSHNHGPVHVNGYYRSNGTYVHGYTRSR